MAAYHLPALPTMDPLLDPGAEVDAAQPQRAMLTYPAGTLHLGITAQPGWAEETPRAQNPPGLALLPEPPRQPLC